MLFVYTYICVCVSENAIVSKDVIFYLLLHNVIRWSNHIYKKCSFLLLHSLLFLMKNTRKVIKRNWQSVTQVNGMKNVIMQMTYFLNDPMVNILFYYHIIIYIERKWFLKRSLVTILHWNPHCKISVFQGRSLMEVSKRWKNFNETETF